MASHIVTSADIPAQGERLNSPLASKVKLISGATSLLLWLVSMFLLLGPNDTWAANYAYSWVFAVFFFFTLAVGGCFWTLLHNVSNSGWGTSVRRVMENLGSVYPFLFLFAFPLALPPVQKWLYEWMNIHREGLHDGAGLFDGFLGGFYGSTSLKEWLEAHHHGLLANKLWYMNLVAWYVRFAFYFVGLTLVIRGLRKLSVGQDSDPNPGTSRLFRARFHSTYTLIIFAITITFAGFDWLMALDFSWFSTMWGVYLFAGAALNSMAVIIITCALLQRGGNLKRVVTPEHYHIMGKLLFAFTVFWAYIAFSQFFLIWYANVTEETKYFLIRNTGGWNTAMMLLVLFHFVVPFVVLLQAWLKKKPMALTVLAVYTLVMHVFDHYLISIPERSISLMNLMPEKYAHVQTTIPNAFWGDILAFLTVGTGFLFFYLRALGQNNLYPNRDPRLLESANVSN
ncbi:hypothetical protein HNR46_004066 [Haloferula luteola]|uniref:Quinol:cytochrome c oxidoreductase quinone-binding subunit 2 n=1 Tax=Haloferula luteola TaxID=595692 RepID=A0A840V7V3_9BACT|nr:hypothetical protein [Haloferula luteola]MBB5353803.1 hypothetical protein [Haloferula luteola]